MLREPQARTCTPPLLGRPHSSRGPNIPSLPLHSHGSHAGSSRRTPPPVTTRAQPPGGLSAGSPAVTLACPRSGPSALTLSPGCENRGPHLPRGMEAREGKMDPPHTHSLDSRLGPAGLERAHCPGPLLRGARRQGRCQTQRGHALVGAPWGARQLPQGAGRTPQSHKGCARPGKAAAPSPLGRAGSDGGRALAVPQRRLSALLSVAAARSVVVRGCLISEKKKVFVSWLTCPRLIMPTHPR